MPKGQTDRQTHKGRVALRHYANQPAFNQESDCEIFANLRITVVSSSTPGPPEVRGGGAEDDLHGVSLHDAGPQDLQTTLREQTPQEPHPSRTAGSFDGFP